MFSVGNVNNEREITHAYTFPDGVSFWDQFLTYPLDFDRLEDIDRLYSADDYWNHDWFALADSFYEMCDQFIPSSFLLGEDIAENSIFVDAFKAVLNPTRAIKLFIDLGRRTLKSYRKMNLKQVSRKLAKDSSDSHLMYIFGIKPAIDDIISALEVHRKVSSRMKFLSAVGGRFVPIRVRKPLASAFENQTPTFSLDGLPSYFFNCKVKRKIACISAYGRVREDLNFGDTWSAYLQYFGVNKVVGLAWELIPFSFVVDWFTNAQEHINQLTRLQTGGPFTEFRGLTASEKKELVEELYVTPFRNQSLGMNQISPLDPVKLGDFTQTDYRRYLTIPNDSSDFDWSSFGPYQLLASGSLLLQRALR
jgi:hypothetical protein